MVIKILIVILSTKLRQVEDRDVIFPFFSGIPFFSNQIDHPRESRRSVEIFLDQYREGGGLYSP